jgi:hypothetical protein
VVKEVFAGMRYGEKLRRRGLGKRAARFADMKDKSVMLFMYSLICHIYSTLVQIQDGAFLSHSPAPPGP